MTEVMMNTPAMDEIGLSPRKDGLSYQVSALLAASAVIPYGIAWAGLQTQSNVPFYSLT